MPISPLVVFVPPAEHSAIAAGEQTEIKIPVSKTWSEVLEDPRGYFDTLIVLVFPQEGGKWRNKLEFPFRGWTKVTPEGRSRNKGHYAIEARP